MPFCTSCGAEIAADKKFCGQCGAPVEPIPAPAAPVTRVIPVEQQAPAIPSPVFSPSLKKPQIPKNMLIVGGIIAIIVIIAAIYFVGLPMLKNGAQKPVDVLMPSPSITSLPVVPSARPTLKETTPIPDTPSIPVQVRDDRLEEEYEPVYALNQKFSFGQKENFPYELTRPPLYIKFNLTPTMIIRHRLIAIGTSNEHYENTTEVSPYAWFEVKVLDAGSGAVIDQQGYGNDYPDITKHSFMVRQKGNYLIVMSGNEVNADIHILVGTQ